VSTNHSSSTGTDYAAMRTAMVVSQLRPNGVTDTRLLAAMGDLPRERFLPDARRAVAYADRPVPLANGRALNPPMTTARLLDALKLTPNARLLIVGAASGYATAVARELCASVTGIEEDADLIALAPEGLSLTQGSLVSGAPDAAPFDAILIDGAIESIPDALLAQLADNGRIACAIVRDGVARLSIGRRGGSGFALSDFADAEAVVLPGFAAIREFVFE
jgi:protein-L-isoaspartate(D-aspartate) O-methyltransferase